MNKPKITLLEDRVLIKPLPKETKTASGLFIPEEVVSDEGILKGMILVTGTADTLLVKPDDVVLYGKHSGREVRLEGESYLIMRQMDIVGIL
jgi:chaperonin GroES